MLLRGRSAAHIARRAGLIVDLIEQPEVVRLDGLVIEIGPGASDRKVLEVAYRHVLGKLGDDVDEAEVSRCVAAHERMPASTREPPRQSAVA